jgi:hypothetical protein
MITKPRKLHQCHGGQYGTDGWPMCCVCDGRIHDNDCSSRMNRLTDCCPARHKMLYDQGHVRGLFDSSQAMWSEANQQGYHDPKGDL